MSRLRAALGTLLLALVIVSCAGSKPDGREALEARIRQESPGEIELVSYRETNAVDNVVNGGRYFQIEYQAEIAFLVDRLWPAANFLNSGSFSGAGDVLPAAERRRGEHYRIAGVVVYQPAEAGWRVVAFGGRSVERVESATPAGG